MKNTLLLTYSANILVRLLTVNMKNCLTPKITKCATPFLTSNCIENASFSVVLMSCKVNFHVVRSPLQNSVCWPHYRHYRRKNAAPSSGTSPFGSYKEVLPPPPTPHTALAPGRQALFSRRRVRPFLVSVNRDVLKTVLWIVNCQNPRLFTRGLKISWRK